MYVPVVAGVGASLTVVVIAVVWMFCATVRSGAPEALLCYSVRKFVVPL